MLGYHHVTSGLGQAARQITRSLHAAGIETRTVDVTGTNSPRLRDPAPVPDDLFEHTLAIVTATELPAVWDALPAVRAVTERMIGYWFWELAEVPASHEPAIDIVDEIWAPTRFIFDAYIGKDKPVRLLPTYLAEPTSTEAGVHRWRHRLGPESFHFVSSLDLFSIIHRKNPLGSITSFVRAFGDERTVPVRLTLKVLNGEGLPDDLDHIVSAAAADSRISVLSENLGVEEHAEFLAAADCFVSLHRSEGLGLQLADSMWLGTPVLATRYGGNLDFMDDSCAALVDAELVRVGDGRGAYPNDALWADPDLEAAAHWMRRLVHDEALRAALASQAGARMARQPSEREFGTMYAQNLAAT